MHVMASFMDNFIWVSISSTKILSGQEANDEIEINSDWCKLI